MSEEKYQLYYLEHKYQEFLTFSIIHRLCNQLISRDRLFLDFNCI